MRRFRIDVRTLGLLTLALAIVVSIRSESSGQNPESGTAGEIEALQRQRVETLRELVDYKRVEFGAGTIPPQELVSDILKLFDAELEYTRDHSERVSICQQRLEFLRDVEREANVRVDLGDLATADLLAAQAERLLAEIRLLQEQSVAE